MWRSAFLQLSRNSFIRHMSVNNPLARQVARRFVAGESIEDAVAVTRELNAVGAGAEIDYLGENVARREQAESAASNYLQMLDRIAGLGADAQVSLKLTQMGLDLDRKLCSENVHRVVDRAANLGNFVWLDMESSDYTDRTLEIYRELRSRYANVGVAIQSCLRRSKVDVRDLLSIGGTIRLCKGAYMEPASIAFPDKADVDRAFTSLAEMLLSGHGYQAIATHDVNMIKHVLRFARDNDIRGEPYEFQMLYGVRRDLQRRLVREGHKVRVYVPYGRDWYPYLMRRLAERPANLLFVLSNVVREAGSRAA